jgi:hypothetical protein
MFNNNIFIFTGGSEKNRFQIGTADKNIVIAESKVSVEKAKVLLSV